QIVQALARKDSFTKQILIYIGDGRCVRVDPYVAGKDTGKPGSVCRLGRYRNTRLEDSISSGNHVTRCIDLGPVQRMCGRTDEVFGATRRQLGIGIKGDDILNGYFID